MSHLSIYALILAASAALAAPASAQQAQVALGEPVSVETLAMAIAFERAKEKGVDLKITSFSKEELAVQAVISGQAQIGIATPYSVMQKSQGTIKNLVTLTRLVFFPIVEKATYKSWKDLNGQPFTFHARGSGTEAIGNIMAKRQGIQFGQRNYISGSDNRIVALMNGQIKATILDLANTNILMEKAGDRFAKLPGVDNPASDEILFARTDWLDKNKDKADILVAEFVKLWDEMQKNPGIIEQERVKRGMLKDLPKEVVEKTTAFYTTGVKEGLYKAGGGDAAKSDFEFYGEAGQLTGSNLKVEDFWDLAPYDKAVKK
ncbi:MAG: NitT/TauT family transport system substrate-binding protein [Alphaproteobacteria bacterium]|jgi:NitT/TauT family transport system substrate-binding protein|nr:NitT/TauT family transport system substrate-binding protein [Alphaproteobacteria bacterium]